MDGLIGAVITHDKEPHAMPDLRAGQPDLRAGQQVEVVNVIHRPTGSAWPGTRGTVRRIADPGPTPTEITVDFEGFTATGVYGQDLRPT